MSRVRRSRGERVREKCNFREAKLQIPREEWVIVECSHVYTTSIRFHRILLYRPKNLTYIKRRHTASAVVTRRKKCRAAKARRRNASKLRIVIRRRTHGCSLWRVSTNIANDSPPLGLLIIFTISLPVSMLSVRLCACRSKFCHTYLKCTYFRR